jgi:hypothetical protein
MIYAILQSGQRRYFDSVDALFEFFNSGTDAVGGWVGG